MYLCYHITESLDYRVIGLELVHFTLCNQVTLFIRRQTQYSIAGSIEWLTIYPCTS